MENKVKFDPRDWIMNEMATEQLPEMWLQQLVTRAYAAGSASGAQPNGDINPCTGDQDCKHVCPAPASGAQREAPIPIYDAAKAAQEICAEAFGAEAVEKLLQRHYNVALAIGDTREPERVHVSGWLNFISLAKELNKLAAPAGAASGAPEWFKRLNEKLKLVAQEHGIPFPYSETLEGRVMAVVEALAASSASRASQAGSQ